MSAAPPAWAHARQLRVLATGFGLGHDFLATWQAWRDDPERPAILHYAAVEERPLAEDLLRQGAGPFSAIARLLAQQWIGLVPGFHRLQFEEGRVVLTLCIGEGSAMLKELAFTADAVWLAGRPPGMPPVLKAVARFCRPGTLLATPMAAAPSEADLAHFGFAVGGGVSPPGTLRCVYAPRWKPRTGRVAATEPDHCIVIGAGLAGAAVAASLARRGWNVDVYDGAAEPAQGASQLPAGLLAPHTSADDNLLSRLSRSGVRLTLTEAARHLEAGRDWALSGVLERGLDPAHRPHGGPQGTAWLRAPDAEQRAAARLPDGDAAGWHALAAWIRPAALVRAWLTHPAVRFHGSMHVSRLQRVQERWHLIDSAGATMADAPLVVVAGALASRDLVAGLALHPVRGQVAWALHGNDAPPTPDFPVNGHGHWLPRVPLPGGEAWLAGSTYARGDADPAPRAEDTAANLRKLHELLPAVGDALAPAFATAQVRAWSGVRCVATDRRPLAGEVEPGLWVSTAMGSRGLTFASLCAEWIAARLHDEPSPLPQRLGAAIDVRRLRPKPA